MDIQVEQADLAEALTKLNKVLPLPSVKSGVVSLKIAPSIDGYLELSGIGMDMTTSGTIDVPMHGESKVDLLCVNGRELLDLVKDLDRGLLTLGIAEERWLTVTQGPSVYRISLDDSSKFWVMPDLSVEPDATFSMSVSSTSIKQAILAVAPAAAPTDDVPVLATTCLEYSPQTHTLTLAATDRYRLAKAEVAASVLEKYEDLDLSDVYQILVPAKFLIRWARSLPLGEQFVMHFDVYNQLCALSSSPNQVKGDLGFSVITKTTPGDYPKYRQLYHSGSFPSTVTLDTKKLRAAITRANKAVKNDRSQPVVLDFNTDTVTITVGQGDEVVLTEQMPCQLVGDPVKIAFNPLYLLAGLKPIKAKDVRVQMRAATKPAEITAADPADNYRYLIMPVRLGG